MFCPLLGSAGCDVGVFRHRGDFQVVTDVHSVHVFLWDCIGAVQISQQACWLKIDNTILKLLIKGRNGRRKTDF